MTVNQTAEYALRAIVWLATRQGAPQTTQQIADATCVSPKYLPKVFQPLTRAGFVAGVRGVHGGYTLEADPRELRLLDIVACMRPAHDEHADGADPHRYMKHHPALNTLGELLGAIADESSSRLAAVTLADLLNSDRFRPDHDDRTELDDEDLMLEIRRGVGSPSRLVALN